MVGQFNLGNDEHDYRLPDGGLHRDFTDRVFYPAAALVTEIVSPGNESWGKVDFYAGHGVEELLIVDAQEKMVGWLGLEAGEYRHLKRSRVIELRVAELEFEQTRSLSEPQPVDEETEVTLEGASRRG